MRPPAAAAPATHLTPPLKPNPHPLPTHAPAGNAFAPPDPPPRCPPAALMRPGSSALQHELRLVPNSPSDESSGMAIDDPAAATAATPSGAATDATGPTNAHAAADCNGTFVTTAALVPMPRKPLSLLASLTTVSSGTSNSSPSSNHSNSSPSSSASSSTLRRRSSLLRISSQLKDEACPWKRERLGERRINLRLKNLEPVAMATDTPSASSHCSSASFSASMSASLPSTTTMTSTSSSHHHLVPLSSTSTVSAMSGVSMATTSSLGRPFTPASTSSSTDILPPPSMATQDLLLAAAAMAAATPGCVSFGSNAGANSGSSAYSFATPFSGAWAAGTPTPVPAPFSMLLSSSSSSSSGSVSMPPTGTGGDNAANAQSLHEDHNLSIMSQFLAGSDDPVHPPPLSARAASTIPWAPSKLNPEASWHYRLQSTAQQQSMLNHAGHPGGNSVFATPSPARSLSGASAVSSIQQVGSSATQSPSSHRFPFSVQFSPRVRLLKGTASVTVPPPPSFQSSSGSSKAGATVCSSQAFSYPASGSSGSFSIAAVSGVLDSQNSYNGSATPSRQFLLSSRNNRNRKRTRAACTPGNSPLEDFSFTCGPYQKQHSVRCRHRAGYHPDLETGSDDDVDDDEDVGNRGNSDSEVYCNHAECAFFETPLNIRSRIAPSPYSLNSSFSQAALSGGLMGSVLRRSHSIGVCDRDATTRQVFLPAGSFDANDHFFIAPGTREPPRKRVYIDPDTELAVVQGPSQRSRSISNASSITSETGLSHLLRQQPIGCGSTAKPDVPHFNSSPAFKAAAISSDSSSINVPSGGGDGGRGEESNSAQVCSRGSGTNSDMSLDKSSSFFAGAGAGSSNNNASVIKIEYKSCTASNGEPSCTKMHNTTTNNTCSSSVGSGNRQYISAIPNAIASSTSSFSSLPKIMGTVNYARDVPVMINIQGASTALSKLHINDDKPSELTDSKNATKVSNSGGGPPIHRGGGSL